MEFSHDLFTIYVEEKFHRGAINFSVCLKVLCDERLGVKLRVTENRCVLFDSFTYIYIYIYVSAPIARDSVHCLIWLVIFKVTLGGSSRALKCNSIYLIKSPLISFGRHSCS